MREMHDDEVLLVNHLAPPSMATVVVAPSAPGGEMVSGPTSGRGWPGKRLLDVLLSFGMLLVTLPLFVLLAIAIKLTSSGPVFFRQTRVGRWGNDFPILKFRTMYIGSEERLRNEPALHEMFLEGSHKIPCRLDPRVTRVGRLLRQSSLDELPQLLNVLAGHMSMVGPRPVVHDELRDYDVHLPAYLALRPGLTGLWQVSGRSTVRFPERAELDKRYLRTCGPWTDTKIILRTPRAVLAGLGAD